MSHRVRVIAARGISTAVVTHAELDKRAVLDFVLVERSSISRLSYQIESTALTSALGWCFADPKLWSSPFGRGRVENVESPS